MGAGRARSGATPGAEGGPDPGGPRKLLVYGCFERCSEAAERGAAAGGLSRSPPRPAFRARTSGGPGRVGPGGSAFVVPNAAAVNVAAAFAVVMFGILHRRPPVARMVIFDDAASGGAEEKGQADQDLHRSLPFEVHHESRLPMAMYDLSDDGSG